MKNENEINDRPNQLSKFRFVRFYWRAQEGTPYWLMQFLASAWNKVILQIKLLVSE